MKLQFDSNYQRNWIQHDNSNVIASISLIFSSFFGHLDRLSSSDYIPTDADILAVDVRMR